MWQNSYFWGSMRRVNSSSSHRPPEGIANREKLDDVIADGVVVGRIFRSTASPEGSPWMWTLAFGHHEDCIPTHGYEPTREAAMAACRHGRRRSGRRLRYAHRTGCRG